MIYLNYHVQQNGKILSCTDEAGKITINKYDNKVSQITFHLDGTIPGRLYFAMLNPVTNKYFMLPVINNELIIGTEISVYPGKWKSLLIGVQDDYEVVDNDIDQSKVTYVSNEFNRIIVRDNFLDEENIELNSNPAIDAMLESLRAAQDQLENAAIKADEACAITTDNKNEVSIMYDELREIHECIESDKETINDTISTALKLQEEFEKVKSEVSQAQENIAESQKNVASLAHQVTVDKDAIEKLISGFNCAYAEKLEELGSVQDNATAAVNQAGAEQIQKLLEEGEKFTTIKVQEAEPKEENVEIWVDTSEGKEEFSLPEIKDSEISPNDTWSSEKINAELEKIKAMLQ